MTLITSDELNSPQWLPTHERIRREQEALRKRIVRVVGVDLGQAADYTAVAAIESTPDVTTVYGLERFRGIPYVAKGDNPSIVKRVKEIMALPQLADATLLIDYTGVGRPTYDIFVSQGLKCTPINIHGGNKVSHNNGVYGVPKRDLVFSLVGLFQAQQLRLPVSPESQILTQELLNFRMKINTKAHDSYEAWREKEHDDILLALSLCAWYVAHKYRPRKRGSIVARDEYE